jgi:hypothetical protein
MTTLRLFTKLILDRAEDFFAWCTFKIIELKDRWGMNK